MKKLLLTLLGAAALCGLSPHPASAKAPVKTTATPVGLKIDSWTRWNSNRITLNNRVQAAISGDADMTLTDQNWENNGKAAPTGDLCYGWGQILLKNTGDTDPVLIIDFNFDGCNKDAEKPYQATNYVTDAYFKASVGTKISFSAGQNKRIKSIQFRAEKLRGEKRCVGGGGEGRCGQLV